MAATPLAEQLDGDCAAWQDVVELCQRFQPAMDRDDPRGRYGNALRSAVERAVLDAYGRLFGEHVSAVTAHFEPAQPLCTSKRRVRYSGAITVESPRGERLSALKMRLYGFAHCKVKVGMDGADECRRLGSIRSWIGRGIDLRLDANEAWHGSRGGRR